ncbi:MAG: hypothetical protein ACR2NT_10625 [Acidimicrobiia bacterium]
MTDPKWKQVKASIAHIEGDKPGAARYNAAMTDSDRQGYDNLLLLCPNHHRKIDYLTPDEYTVERLRQIKADHETRCGERSWETDSNLANFAELLLVVEQGSSPPNPVGIAWELTRLSGYNFQLRNISREFARGVTIDPAQIMEGVLHRDLPNGIDVRGGASHGFLIQGTWGKSLPRELWVTWEGGPSGGEPLPMPPP